MRLLLVTMRNLVVNYNFNAPLPFLSSSPHGEHHEDSHGVHEILVLYFISNPPQSCTSSPHGEHHEVSHGVLNSLAMNFFSYNRGFHGHHENPHGAHREVTRLRRNS